MIFVRPSKYWRHPNCYVANAINLATGDIIQVTVDISFIVNRHVNLYVDDTTSYIDGST
jgi:hypothetical protein